MTPKATDNDMKEVTILRLDSWGKEVAHAGIVRITRGLWLEMTGFDAKDDVLIGTHAKLMKVLIEEDF